QVRWLRIRQNSTCYLAHQSISTAAFPPFDRPEHDRVQYPFRSIGNETRASTRRQARSRSLLECLRPDPRSDLLRVRAPEETHAPAHRARCLAPHRDRLDLVRGMSAALDTLRLPFPTPRRSLFRGRR